MRDDALFITSFITWRVSAVLFFFFLPAGMQKDIHEWLQSGKRASPVALAAPSPSKQAKADAVEATVFSRDKAAQLLVMPEFKDQPLKVKRSSCIAERARP